MNVKTETGLETGSVNDAPDRGEAPNGLTRGRPKAPDGLTDRSPVEHRAADRVDRASRGGGGKKDRRNCESGEER
jgi:hypothetical protein